jgi:hypothetical protein
MAATDRHRKGRSVLAMLTAGGRKIEQAGGQADVPRAETTRRRIRCLEKRSPRYGPSPGSAQVVIRRHGLGAEPGSQRLGAPLGLVS